MITFFDVVVKRMEDQRQLDHEKREDEKQALHRGNEDRKQREYQWREDRKQEEHKRREDQKHKRKEREIANVEMQNKVIEKENDRLVTSSVKPFGSKPSGDIAFDLRKTKEVTFGHL